MLWCVGWVFFQVRKDGGRGEVFSAASSKEECIGTDIAPDRPPTMGI